jgi:hypothetical protein
MKTKMNGLLILFLLLLINTIMAQYIASLKGNKVEVRDLKGKLIAGYYYSGLKDIAQGGDIVVLWYESNKVEVRGYTLKYIAAQFYSNLKKISASGDNVVLYYDNGKVEVRDMNLKYISARFQ